MKVLANDGLAKSGIAALGLNGFEVDLTTVAQDQLVGKYQVPTSNYAMSTKSFLSN